MASRAVARDAIASLRQQIAKIEDRLVERLEAPGKEESDVGMLLRRAGVPVQGMLPLGAPAFDAALGGGVPRAGLTEMHAPAMRDAAALAGFALAVTMLISPAGLVLWIAANDLFREAGQPYAQGLLHRFGIVPGRLMVAQAPRPLDALWIAEEAANAHVFGGIVLEVARDPRVLDLVATRRLHRRALLAGHPVFLLRVSGSAQPTAAPLRLRLRAAPSSPRHTLSGPLHGSIGPPAFHVDIDKSRTAILASTTLEWSHGHFQERQPGTALPRPVVSLPAGRKASAPALRRVLAFTRTADAAPVQPAGREHAARRRHGRTG